MSNLEDLVPPLELCKRIPFPKFEDSVFVWDRKNSWIMERTYMDCDKEEDGFYVPAPTLQEILAEFYAEGLCCPSARFDSDQWTVYWIDNHVNEIWCAKESDKNPATAALKLWLEVNKSVKSKIKSKIKSKEK